MKITKIRLSTLLTIALTGQAISQEWNPTNANPTQNMYRGGKIALGTWYAPDDPSAWYNPAQGPQFESWTGNTLNSNFGDRALRSSFSAACGTSNWMRDNTWITRNGNPNNGITWANWTGWGSASLHNGISIDNSFVQPGTDTKTWWERNPGANIQTWGNDADTYFRIGNGKIGIGKDMWYNPDNAGTWYNTVSGNYFAAPQFELWSSNYPGNGVGDAAMITSHSVRTGSSGSTNWVRHNTYIRRKSSNGNNGWDGIALHDGIAVDNQFLYPGITTLTYWERDPYHDLQSWGSGQSAYMKLDQGKLIVGTKKQNSGNHTGALLQVYGKAVATEVIVTQLNWADFVFDDNYKLPSLKEVESFYKANRHLPEVPTTKEIAENGNDLGKTDALLLQKIEELTLYMVEQQKEIELLKQQVGAEKGSKK
jgi:hypothetical protein